MDLLPIYWKRKNFLAIQNTLPLTIAAVFASTRDFVQPGFRKYFRPPPCLRDKADLSPTDFRNMISYAPYIFATRHILIRYIFGKYFRPFSFRMMQIFCRQSSSSSHISSRRSKFLPDLFSANIFAYQYVRPTYIRTPAHRRNSQRRVPSPDLPSAMIFSPKFHYSKYLDKNNSPPYRHSK